MAVTAKQVAAHLKTQINWQRFVNLSASVGAQLNDAQWRFMKAVVFESSMEVYSDGSVKYVAEEGCDLLVDLPRAPAVKVEMKYTENALYTPKGTKPREVCQGITLMNSKGTNTHKTLPKGYADFLIVVGLRGAAVVSKKTLAKYAQFNGDSITASIPTGEMEFVFKPEDVTAPTITQIDLRKEIEAAVLATLAKIK